MDLLDARNKGLYDRLTLKGALVRFQSGTPDYTSEADRFVVEAMMSSPVVFAAVKGLSSLDSDGVGSKVPKSSGNAAGGGGNRSNRVELTENRVAKIFGVREGHIMDTAENRALLLGVANDPKSVLGLDRFGSTWSAKIQSDGSQVWVQTRNGKI
ncbi:hypothetical protein [Achromobacter sp. ESBL13]|uniref:hypothetical protein n=1 Tax=Achromobacter sp. ESBL13 TaxID=3077328 RepID=UPI002FCAA481